MYEVKRTKTGWVFDITNRAYGMLEQGGVCCRRVLLYDATLRKLGIDPDGPIDEELDRQINHYGTTLYEFLDFCGYLDNPDRVIRRGHIIR